MFADNHQASSFTEIKKAFPWFSGDFCWQLGLVTKGIEGILYFELITAMHV